MKWSCFRQSRISATVWLQGGLRRRGRPHTVVSLVRASCSCLLFVPPGRIPSMPKAAAPTIFFAKRVHHRNEVEGLEKAAAMAGWRVTNKAEAATAIWDVRTLADVTTTEPLPGQLINWWPGLRRYHHGATAGPAD